MNLNILMFDELTLLLHHIVYTLLKLPPGQLLLSVRKNFTVITLKPPFSSSSNFSKRKYTKISLTLLTITLNCMKMFNDFM
jgi:hypothetical protein